VEGVNFVEMVGKIIYPELKEVGANNTKLFKAKLAIPLNDGKFQYVKIAGWARVAEALGELPENTFIRVHGHIEERRYEGKCKSCGNPEYKYWTEVLVDNFVKVD
jgi:hypothetical protein